MQWLLKKMNWDFHSYIIGLSNDVNVQSSPTIGRISKHGSKGHERGWIINYVQNMIYLLHLTFFICKITLIIIVLTS